MAEPVLYQFFYYNTSGTPITPGTAYYWNDILYNPFPDLRRDRRLNTVQTFVTGSAYTLRSIKLAIYTTWFADRAGGDVLVKIYAVDGAHKHTGGALGTSTALDVTEFAVSGDVSRENPETWTEFEFSGGVALEAETEYAFLVYADADNALEDYWTVEFYGNYGVDNYPSDGYAWYDYITYPDDKTYDDSAYTEMTNDKRILYEIYGDLEKPINPSPANAATAVDIGLTSISWLNGGGASKYDIYYTFESPGGGLSLVVSNYPDAGGGERTTYTIPYGVSSYLFSQLERETQYSWRIDAKSDAES